ncbi:PRC and DUF2382 domain-containing protein [Corynebacterium sp. A21]|uniref:PRC and DUF2382 domain-containing protein n=1 Tax=Corynebacterium sp. A21 TaxID=3457318 RepID=UPI003FCF22AC
MTKKNIQDLSSATAYDSNNEKLGSVKEVFVNDGTGQPDFIEVGHGLFGMNSSLVPLRGHRLNSEELHLAFPKEHIKDAPDLNVDEHLDPTQLDTLYRHYGLENTENVENYDQHGRDPRLTQAEADAAATGGIAGGVVGGTAPGQAPSSDSGLSHTQESSTDVYPAGVPDTPGRAAHPQETGELTRSEEQLRIAKDRETTGQARLRKYVVHDTETVEVPVEREEAHVERTPINPEDAANLRDDIAEGEASVTLHEERVRVTKESVPVEKVKLAKETVTDSETVTEDVAREEIETDGVADPDATRNPRHNR